MLFKIPNHPDYIISKGGVVINIKTNHVLTHSMSSSGYLTVYVDGRNELLHRLLAETFIHNTLNLSCVNHKDGNKLNNSLNNLEWCTYGENNRHAYKTGLKSCGDRKCDKAFNRKLTSKDVNYIRNNYKKYDAKNGGRALAKRFNVSESCISAIMCGQNWGGA